MPHEHDESADSQAASEPPGEQMGKTAYEDIERGLVDTDKGPVLDQTYDQVREDADDPLKKLSPLPGRSQGGLGPLGGQRTK